MENIEVTSQDIQSAMQANPLVALQVENQALKRKMLEVTSENKRLIEELAASKNGKSPADGYIAIGRFDEDKKE